MKILLIADVHNKPKGSKKTLSKLKTTISTLESDLIVFLGDIVHGPAVKCEYEKYLKQVLDTVGDKPFATVFGNHDDECYFSKDDILRVLKEYPNCLTNGRNYVLEMFGETLLFIDSGTYYDGKESLYDSVKPQQIKFLLNKIEGKQAVAFQHIIVPEVLDFIEESTVRLKGSVLDGGKWYRIKQETDCIGKLGERPCPPDVNFGEFRALAPHLKAFCFGHDHKNSFEIYIDGVKIIQCAGSGNNSYDKFCASTVKLLDTKTLKTDIFRL